MPVGVVGRAHGLDGSFFVEGPSEREDVFALRATLYVDGEPSEVVSSKRGSHGRPVIRLDRRVQLVGLAVEEEGGRLLGRVKEVLDYPANDVLELDSGVFLPLVEACVRQVDIEGGRIVIAAGFADPE